MGFILFFWFMLSGEGYPSTLEEQLPALAGLDRSRALVSLTLANRKQDPQKTIRYGREAMNLLQSFPDPILELRTCNALCWAYMTTGDLPAALKYGKKARDLADVQENGEELGHALNNLGVLHRRLEAYPKALEYYLKSLKIRQTLEIPVDVASSLNNIGLVYWKVGLYPEALAYHLQALHIEQKAGFKKKSAITLNNIGIVHSYMGNHDKALTWFNHSLKIRHEGGDLAGSSICLFNIARAYGDMRQNERAWKFFSNALEICIDIDHKSGMASAYKGMGNIRFQMKRYKEAIDLLDQSKKIYEGLGERGELADTELRIGRIFLASKDYEKAGFHLAKALEISREIDHHKTHRDAHEELFRLNTLQGHADKALEHFQRHKQLNAEITGLKNEWKVALGGIQAKAEIHAIEDKLLEEEKEIKTLENTLKTLKRNGLIFGGGLLLILLGLASFGYRQKKNLDRQRSLSSQLKRIDRAREEFMHLLERKVAERTNELREKNEELEILDKIVRSINREVEPEALPQSLMIHGRLLFPMADREALLMRRTEDDDFEVVANRGTWEPGFRRDHWSMEDLCQRFMIDLDEHFEDEGTALIASPVEAETEWASLVMSIVWENRMIGLFLFESMGAEARFGEKEQLRLKRFREHAISAIVRARHAHDLLATTEKLKGAQQQLVGLAHQAGMGEATVHFLHNVGNTLSSMNTSTHMVQDLLNNLPAMELVEKVVHLLEENGEDPFSLQPQRRQAVINAMKGIHVSLSDLQNSLKGEMTDLTDGVARIRATLAAQQEHIESQRLDVFREEVELNAFIENLLNRLHTTLTEHGITVERDFGPISRIQVQKFKLERVLTHLIENALVSLSEDMNHSARHLGIHTAPLPDGVRISVVNNGPAIPQPLLKRIFGYGFTTREKARGFGLHYCANALGSMNGRIYAESDEDKPETRFIVELPLG